MHRNERPKPTTPPLRPTLLYRENECTMPASCTYSQDVARHAHPSSRATANAEAQPRAEDSVSPAIAGGRVRSGHKRLRFKNRTLQLGFTDAQTLIQDDVNFQIYEPVCDTKALHTNLNDIALTCRNERSTYLTTCLYHAMTSSISCSLKYGHCSKGCRFTMHRNESLKPTYPDHRPPLLYREYE